MKNWLLFVFFPLFAMLTRKDLKISTLGAELGVLSRPLGPMSSWSREPPLLRELPGVGVGLLLSGPLESLTRVEAFEVV